MNAAADDGGGSDLQLAPGVAASIAQTHANAASRISGLAGSVPDLDAGYGGAALADILSRVLGTADTLAMVNEDGVPSEKKMKHATAMPRHTSATMPRVT